MNSDLSECLYGHVEVVALLIDLGEQCVELGLHNQRVQVIAIVLQLEGRLDCLLRPVVGLEPHLKLGHVVPQVVVVLVLHRLLVVVERLPVLVSLLQGLTHLGGQQTVPGVPLQSLPIGKYISFL